MLFSLQNALVTSGPNWMPTPRLDWERPAAYCGSLHIRSHMRPSSGGCRLRSMARMSSRVTLSFENKPPCMHNMRELIMCDNGRKLNISVNMPNICWEYLDLHSPSNPYIWFIVILSWFPIGKKTSIYIKIKYELLSWEGFSPRAR